MRDPVIPEALEYIRATLANGGEIEPEMLGDALSEVDRLTELEEATYRSLKRWIEACGITRSERDGLREELTQWQLGHDDQVNAARAQAMKWTPEQQQALADAVWHLRSVARHTQADSLIAAFPARNTTFDCPTCPAKGIDPCAEVVDAIGGDPVWAECARHPKRKYPRVPFKPMSGGDTGE